MGSKKKFKDVPLEVDTHILWESVVKTGDYDTLLQAWSWDGVTAMSAIFVAEDVHSLADDELIELIKIHRNEFQSTPEVKRDSKFCFVNFNSDLE
jgi:hypothetical protein